jgi:hypothetical protein
MTPLPWQQLCIDFRNKGFWDDTAVRGRVDQDDHIGLRVVFKPYDGGT